MFLFIKEKKKGKINDPEELVPQLTQHKTLAFLRQAIACANRYIIFKNQNQLIMKNVTVLLLLIFFFGSLIMKAQSLNPSECGMPAPTSPPVPVLDKNHCFNVDLVQQTCTKLWVRINVHFFLDDNCEGTLDPLGEEDIPIEDAYEVAEDLINRANGQLENLRQQWVQIPLWNITEAKPVQCNPIRYALSGVYVHCNTQALNTSGSDPAWFRENYGVNINTEFNAFAVEWIDIQPNGPSANGQADTWGGKAFTFENFYRNVFNHEMGHVFNLYHTFDVDDFVDDTPNVRYKIDYNCDGDTDDDWTSSGGLSELVIHSGLWCHPDDVNCDYMLAGIGPIGYDGDGVIDYQDPCDANLIASGCLPEPGCSWDYYSNNIMHYGGYADCCGAFTEGQITRMLEYLSTPQGCGYKEVITDDICLPPMANIHILPTEYASVEDDCAFCFHTETSIHDATFQLEFFNPSGTLHYTTTWQDGPTRGYCISRSIKYADEYKRGFIAGVEYTAVLTVENDCGEQASESITFTLPDLGTKNCFEIPVPDLDIKIEMIYPNPLVNTISYEYKAERGGHLNA